ncbi:MBL fold metallo-hydrolase, partial [Streptomyces flaveolus]
MSTSTSTTTGAGADARAAVHAASGHRLGAARPRQEGPTDLRLVPPALAAWATAALVLDAAPEWSLGVVLGCVVTAGALLLGTRRRAARGWAPVPVAAVLLCVAASAASAALHGADLRRGPVPALARQYATVTAEVEITADPRLTRARVRGDRATPPAVVIEADARRVAQADGRTVATRAPVLVIVDAGAGTGAGGGTGTEAPGRAPAPGPAAGGPRVSG